MKNQIKNKKKKTFLDLFKRIKNKLLMVGSSLTKSISNMVTSTGGRSSVLAPFLIFLGVLFIGIPLICWGISMIEDETTKIIIGSTLGVAVLAFIIFYLVIYFRNPDHLRSEWYNIEHKKLTMMEQKGGKISFNSVDLIPMPQPLNEPNQQPKDE